MLNHIWALLIVIGILLGLGNAIRNASVGEKVVREVDGKKVVEVVTHETWQEKAKAIGGAGNRLSREVFNMVGFTYTDQTLKVTKDGAVGIAVGYIGLIAFWLGLMRIAEASGLIALLSRMIAPLFRFIFPAIPRNHPASGAILMNFAANMLGLDNAATPLGIKAMKELQTLNGRKDTASNAMCMFLALNVSSLTLIPASVIALRGQKGSEAPMSFYPVMLVATACGTLTAFFLSKMMERVSADTPRADELPPEATEVQEENR